MTKSFVVNIWAARMERIILDAREALDHFDIETITEHLSCDQAPQMTVNESQRWLLHAFPYLVHLTVKAYCNFLCRLLLWFCVYMTMLVALIQYSMATIVDPTISEL